MKAQNQSQNILDTETRTARFFDGCLPAILIVVAIVATVAAITGCTTDAGTGDAIVRIPAAVVDAVTDAAQRAAEAIQQTQTAAEPGEAVIDTPAASEPAPGTTAPPTDDADEVPFADLKWTCGGFNGGSAKECPAVQIGSLKVSSSGMSYKYTTASLSVWGLAKDDAGALACLFVRRNGAWTGGKFDWISSSRLSRDFKNISGGYNGWPTDAIGTADAYAFVIVSENGKKRTNVIACSR